MKKKILGISVCILLMAAAVPLTESSKNIMMYPTPPRTSETSMAENWTEIQKLLASDGTSPDNFGWSVSLDGDTALVGAAPDDNGKGSAYVFTRSGTSWTQQVKLLASDGAANDLFGNSVSLDGDTALIGAPYDDDNGDKSGSVYVFTRTGGLWTQEVKLLATDDSTGATFGRSVSLYGNTAFIGADYYDYHGNGAAYVFTRTGTTWTQQAKLLASDGALGDYFGFSVSLSGDTALIGAFGDDDNGLNSGSAYIFTQNDSTWTEQQKLIPLDNEEDDYFGWSVTLEGDSALIGAKFDQNNGIDSGSAYVFTRIANTWTEQQKLLALDGSRVDQFGYSVSLCNGTALIGANYGDGNVNGSGSAYVFIRNGTTWTQQTKLLASDGGETDDFGKCVSLDGDTAFIGAHGHDDYRGAVYVFMKDSVLPNLDIAITGGIGINAIITNNGITNASDVQWWIHVEGGILQRINKTTNGTIAIQAGDSKTVKTGLFFGLGPIMITAKAAYISETTEGIYLFIFSIVK